MSRHTILMEASKAERTTAARTWPTPPGKQWYSVQFNWRKCDGCGERIVAVMSEHDGIVLVDVPARVGGEYVLEESAYHTPRAVKFYAEKHEGWRRYRRHNHG